MKIPNDLSGPLKLKIFMWKKFGHGKDCICGIDVRTKPMKMSIVKFNERVLDMAAAGTRVAWHSKLPFELHGDLAFKKGKHGYAIQDIQIAAEEEVYRDE
jgi:hypothetical protein